MKSSGILPPTKFNLQSYNNRKSEIKEVITNSKTFRNKFKSTDSSSTLTSNRLNKPTNKSQSETEQISTFQQNADNSHVTTNTTIPLDTITNTSTLHDTITNTTIPLDTNTNTTIPLDTNTNTTIPLDTNTNTTIPLDTNTNTSIPLDTNTNTTQEENEIKYNEKPTTTNQDPIIRVSICDKTNTTCDITEKLNETFDIKIQELTKSNKHLEKNIPIKNGEIKILTSIDNSLFKCDTCMPSPNNQTIEYSVSLLNPHGPWIMES